VILQEQTNPTSVPHRDTSPASKPALLWSPLSAGPQVLPGACFCVDFPWGHSFLWMYLPAPAQGPPCAAGGYLPHCGPPWTAGGQPASLWSSPQAAGESLFQCPERFLSLDAGAVVQLSSLLKYVITEALPPSLIGLTLASCGSILELAGIGSARPGGSFQQLLTEAIPAASLLPKLCHGNSVKAGGWGGGSGSKSYKLNS